MKFLIALSLLISAPAFAGVSVTCAEEGYSVTATLEGKVAPYVLSKDGQEVSRGEFEVIATEFDDSFLKAFVIVLQTDNSGLGVGIPAIKDLNAPGVYEGKADLFIPYDEKQYFDGATVPCSVTIE